jgi:hypothetical protein
MNKELLTSTFQNTSLTAIYIFLVSQLMQSGDKLFSNASEIIGPFVVLLLFSLSTAVVGGLVFGKSIMLFFENKKRDSIIAAFYSIGWLAVYTILGLTIMLVIR